MGTHFCVWYPLLKWKPMMRYREYFIWYRHPQRMTGHFAGMSSLLWGYFAMADYDTRRVASASQSAYL